MASGGTRARSGPPPDPNALRRDRDADGWTTLPVAGRVGDPPPWPLSRVTHREGTLWAREWRRPQAVVWERNGMELEVALYVRSFAAAEKPKATVAARTLVRQQQEALGLSIPGLARNRWRIVDEQPVAPTRGATPGGEARERFRVVTGGADG